MSTMVIFYVTDMISRRRLESKAGLTAKPVARQRVHWPGDPGVQEPGKLREMRVENQRERTCDRERKVPALDMYSV